MEDRISGVRRFVHDLVHGYGSFLFFTRPSANLLLVACTMLQPWVGLLGLLGGMSTLLWRRWLALSTVAGGLEVVNGVFSGLVIGLLFAPSWRTVALGLCAGPLAVLVSAWLGDVLRRQGLPLLSGSFVIVGGGLMAVGRAMGLPFALSSPPTPVGWLPAPVHDVVQAMGGIYLTRTLTGGLLVLAALMLSSRTLVLLAVLAGALAEVLLWGLGIPASGLSGNSAISVAMMAAIMTGGLFALPSGRATLVALFAAACATLVSVSLFNVLWFMALPPLALPYLVTTWLVMLTLRGERGRTWARHWRPAGLPERTLDARRQADARGLSPHSIALRAPFLGRWDLYQGFEGRYTHQRPWQHALDFHRLIDGKAHRGDGKRSEDFFCFGLPVRSPVWGQVVACRDDMPDNAPGEVDLARNWGNHVLIAIGGDDYVLLAHLQQGSLSVVLGEGVAPGRQVGRCGNSGRSPQPHIHLHVQTGFALGSPTRPFHLSGVCVQEEGRVRFLLDAIPKEGDRIETPTVGAALERGLHWPVGTRLTYAVALSGGPEEERVLETGLTPANLFTLFTERGAGTMLAETGDLLALYERRGPP
ncbi:MAG: urea transporter, partial [Alphaproteobacteria bacterium]|nr:urea transporter [Alphaproteobacteria bacterium]